ncbi:hypothetical protein PG993_001299 [Apiospora rasikravindrae]|uniref:Uncharacterized protein n=1 Tax=Apiospora rasikravindrae TaxID=990691 RepID=A0ABR1UB03_9PEZI
MAGLDGFSASFASSAYHIIKAGRSWGKLIDPTKFDNTNQQQNGGVFLHVHATQATVPPVQLHDMT